MPAKTRSSSAVKIAASESQQPPQECETSSIVVDLRNELNILQEQIQKLTTVAENNVAVITALKGEIQELLIWKKDATAQIDRLGNQKLKSNSIEVVTQNDSLPCTAPAISSYDAMTTQGCAEHTSTVNVAHTEKKKKRKKTKAKKIEACDSIRIPEASITKPSDNFENQGEEPQPPWQVSKSGRHHNCQNQQGQDAATHGQLQQPSPKTPYEIPIPENASVVIYGVEESAAETASERLEHDKQVVSECVAATFDSNDQVAHIIKVLRIGKKPENSQAERPRPIKIIFADPAQAALFLKNGKNIRSINNDWGFREEYSPQERMKRRALKVELNKKIANGEKNLMIQNGRIVKRFLWLRPLIIKAPVSPAPLN